MSDVQTGFAALLADAEPLDGGLSLVVPASWHQGRTAYGGLSTALAYQAALLEAQDLPPLRSAQVSMLAPLSGRIELRGRVLRRGRNATWIAVELAGAAGPALLATFVFMAPVTSVLALSDAPLPGDLIAPDDARPLGDGRGATFLRHHFDVRFALPPHVPKRAEMCWWVRPRDRTGLDPTGEVLLTADALPPGVMPLLAPSVPVSTMQWQVNLVGVPEPSEWWLLRSAAEYGALGNSSQRMAMWDQAGRPVALGTQSLAIFG